MAHVIASFTVSAGTAAEDELELAGLTPDKMAEKIYSELDISGPEPGDLIGFTVDDVSYELQNGHWVVEGTESPTPLFPNARLDAALDAAWAAFVEKRNESDGLYDCLRAGVEAALAVVDETKN